MKKIATTLLIILKKLFGGFTCLLALGGILSWHTSNEPPDLIIAIMLGVITFLLLKPEKHKKKIFKPTEEENSVNHTTSLENSKAEINEPHNENSMTYDIKHDVTLPITEYVDHDTTTMDETVSVSSVYIETDSTVYRADNEKISTQEIPYLQQLGRDKAVAKYKYTQYLKLINESYQLMYNTADPRTLCNRYNFAKEKLDELIYYRNQGLINDSLELTNCSQLLSDDNYIKLIMFCYKKNLNKAESELKTKRGIESRLTRFWKTIQDSISNELYLRLKLK